MPSEDLIRPLADRLIHWTESELRPLCSDEYEIQANRKLAAEIFSILPNTLLLVEPDCSQVIVLRSQCAEVTSETFANYVVGDASQAESMAEERAELRREALDANDQDAGLLAGLQLTRSMDLGRDTQPTESWDTTPRRFQRIWAHKLLAAR